MFYTDTVKVGWKVLNHGSVPWLIHQHWMLTEYWEKKISDMGNMSCNKLENNCSYFKKH